MEILRKFLFLACFVSVCSSAAMHKKNLVNFVESSDEESCSSEHEASNPEDTETFTKTRTDEIINNMKIASYNNYFGNTKKYKNVTVSNVKKTVAAFPEDKQAFLSQNMFIVGRNLNPQQCRALRQGVLESEYDELTCSDGKTRYGMLVDKIVHALSPEKEKIDQDINRKPRQPKKIPAAASVTPEKNLSGWQYFAQLFCNNYREVGFGFTAGVAATLGLLKFCSWWTNKNQ